MSANGEEINRREVAWRLFASEFRDANFSYAESDEERAPNYVVTPTGARVNRLFVVGVLTEVEYVSDDYLRARIVDPTGAFVVYAGQYQPDALTFLESADTPMFVAVTGKARTFQPEDSDVVYTSIRPESISEVRADTRDSWVVTTAEQTLERVATMADALDLVERGDDLRAVLDARQVPQGLASGIPLAIDHYGTTEHYLASVRDLALDAARVVAGERDEVRHNAVTPDETGDGTVALDDFTLATGDAQVATPTASADSQSDAAETAVAAAESDAPESAADDTADEAAADMADESTTDIADEAAANVTDKTETEAPVEATVGGAVTDGEPAMDASDESTGGSPADTNEAATDAGASDVADGTSSLDRAAGTVAESEADSVPESDAGSADVEPVDTDEMYELSDEERTEVEENYDVGFSTADEMGRSEDATADASTEPEPATEPSSESASEPADETDLAFEPESDAAGKPSTPESKPAQESEPESPSADEEVADLSSVEETTDSATANLEDAVVEAMQALGGGAGADRDELVQSVMDEHGADQAAVEEAIQDALMSGRCYESGENELTAI